MVGGGKMADDTTYGVLYWAKLGRSDSDLYLHGVNSRSGSLAWTSRSPVFEGCGSICWLDDGSGSRGTPLAHADCPDCAVASHPGRELPIDAGPVPAYIQRGDLYVVGWIEAGGRRAEGERDENGAGGRKK